MPIVRNNERGTLSGKSKVAVKRGRLGTASYWPAGTPIAGNCFGPNNSLPMTNPIPAARPFGTPGNNANFTRADQGRLGGGDLPHPNAGHHRIALQNKVDSMTRDGGTGRMQTPFVKNKNPAFVQNTVIQPHERNSLNHKKVLGVYRTVSGASRTLPSDTAFHRVPPKELPKPQPQPQTNTVALMKTKFAPPSFISRNHLWSDPNQSYLQGRAQPVNGEVGRGRWSTTKRGAAG